MNNSSVYVKTDCLKFRGDLPCLPHKKFGFHCQNCPEYVQTKGKILIIKLGAIGDVIRTTPLLHKIAAEYPDYAIHWLTYSPEILDKDSVTRIFPVTVENIELIKNIKYDLLFNLDKDPIAIALANQVLAKKKHGFTIDEFGHATYFPSEASKHKWLTGLFDDLNKENTKHYVQEIFEICGFEFGGEEYILKVEEPFAEYVPEPGKKVVGLNTGCGGRWTSRLWAEDYWVTTAKSLLEKGYDVILLGGEQEHEKNLRLQKASGAKYFGYFPLKKFIALVDRCDLVITAVTMGMHIAIGLGKKLVLFNNIFNKNEFYLYDKGVILEPDYDCPCYFAATCPNDCMQYLYPETVIEETGKLL